jgi:hypothetical protein
MVPFIYLHLFPVFIFRVIACYDEYPTVRPRRMPQVPSLSFSSSSHRLFLHIPAFSCV